MFVALIAGLCAFGLRPRATLEIPGPSRRLDRILELISACRYSFHDLSRVQLSHGAPRFNMPFEIGLAVATARWRPAHQWFLFEARRFRIQQTLSDLGGTDAYVHGEGPRRLLVALTDALRSEEHTSELQSRRDLVCRLLLEKKNGWKVLLLANLTAA